VLENEGEERLTYSQGLFYREKRKGQRKREGERMCSKPSVLSAMNVPGP